MDLFCKPYDFAWLPKICNASSKKKLRKIVKESYAFSLSTKHTPCPQGLVLQGLLFSVGSSWDTDTPTNIRPMAKRPKMWTLSKAITFRLPSSPTFNWKHRKRPHAHELLLPAVKAERKVSGSYDYEAVPRRYLRKGFEDSKKCQGAALVQMQTGTAKVETQEGRRRRGDREE